MAWETLQSLSPASQGTAGSRAWNPGGHESPVGKGDVRQRAAWAGTVTGSQWTELEGLPGCHRTAGAAQAHPVAAAWPLPGARPAPRAGVRGETRDPQGPSPGPQRPSPLRDELSVAHEEICIDFSGWEGAAPGLEGPQPWGLRATSRNVTAYSLLSITQTTKHLYFA